MVLSSIIKTKTAQVALGLSLATSGMSGCGSDNPSSLINTNDSDAKTYDSLDNIVDSKIHNSSDSKESLTETNDNTIPVCWEKQFEEKDVYSHTSSIQQTKDKGYIIAGYTELDLHYEALILKIDQNGDEEWKKKFAGINNYLAFSAQQTKDEGYIVAGNTDSEGAGKEDAWIVKLDTNGELDWDKTFGGSKRDEAEAIQQTEDGEYIVAGFTYSKGAGNDDVWILKIDEKGNLKWDKTFGGNKSEGASSIRQTKDLGYIVSVRTEIKNGGTNNSYILKLDPLGNKEWEKSYGSGYLTSVQQTKDLGYVATGYTKLSSKEEDYVWVIKLNNEGNLEWEKTFGENYFENEAESIRQTSDEGYIVAGIKKDDWGMDAWILKLNFKGDLQWDRTYGENEWNQANSIQQIEDERYIVGGTTYSNSGKSGILVLKLDKKGKLCE